MGNNKKIEATGNALENKRNKLSNSLMFFGHAISNNNNNIGNL